jgi:[acyl-carrier-protein] S-malonyltransferase
MVVAVEKACEAMKRREQNALILPVGGAFHSPMMEPAREELKQLLRLRLSTLVAGISNVTATAVSSPEEIKKNLIIQLTAQ